MAENLDATTYVAFSRRNLTMMDSRFPRRLSLLVLICTTSRVFQLGLRKSGRAKTRPARSLAKAMNTTALCAKQHDSLLDYAQNMY